MRNLCLLRYELNSGRSRAAKTSETPVKSKDFTGVLARCEGPLSSESGI